MEKPNLMEEVQPCSGRYSFKKDLRLNAWLGVAMAVYVPSLFLLKHHPEWSPLVRGIVALLPFAPGLLYLRDCLRFIRGMDELQARIQWEAFLFAALGALVVTIAVNTLNAHNVNLPGVAHGLGFGGGFVLMFTLWLVGTAIATCRYK